MKTSEGWDLLSIGEISTEKVQKNLREISVFLSNDVRNIKDIVFQYHPLEVVKFAFWEQHRILRKKNSDIFAQQVASRLVAYLSSLLPYWEKPYAQEGEIKPKDWKRITQLFLMIFVRKVYGMLTTILCFYAVRTRLLLMTRCWPSRKKRVISVYQPYLTKIYCNRN